MEQLPELGRAVEVEERGSDLDAVVAGLGDGVDGMLALLHAVGIPGDGLASEAEVRAGGVGGLALRHGHAGFLIDAVRRADAAAAR
jgi:hypothetical protein